MNQDLTNREMSRPPLVDISAVEMVASAPQSSIPLTTNFHRVLIVDDHAYIRLSLKNILLQHGVENVEEAGDGNEAIATLSASSPAIDLIFCDLQMPNRDGIETLRELAHLETKSSIVLMSGEDKSILAAAASFAKSHGLNVLGHITKPISAAKVKRFLTSADSPKAPTRAQSAENPIDDADIRRGIAANEFFVLYQPKVSLKTRELTGVEALVRWRHPKYGLVNPVTFIGIAEQSTTIDQLTDFVLASALGAQSRWAEQGQNVEIAVNISTRSMVRLDLPDLLANIVASQGGKAGSIVLEVTESRLADELTALLDISTRLRLKGFHLAIDDFGTGFSTLEQLSRLPVSELKIDRAFVAGAPDNERTRAILEASLALAERLKLTTVCEGVETAAEWDLIAKLGADRAQGYYVAKPMPAEDLIGWYRAWK